MPLSRHLRIAPLIAGALLLASPVSKAAAQTTGTPPPQVLTLEGALDYALAHYPAVKGAVEQVNASQANVSVMRAAYLPRLDAVWQTNRATANNIFGQVLPQSVIPAMSGPVLASASATSVWGTAAGGLLSWEALDFGLRASTVAEAQAGVDRARADEAVTRLIVQRTVAVAFLNAVSAERAVVAANADVERRSVLARAAHALADNQLRPGADASRADAEHAAARTRAVQAQQAAAIARTMLARLIGLQDGTVTVNGSTLLEAVPAPIDTPARADAHPEVRASEAAAAVARAREQVLDNSDRPRVLLQSALFARGSGANPDGRLDGGANGLGLERANWAAGVQVVFPNLFDYSSLRARRAAASAETRVADAHREESLLSVSAERQTATVLVDSALAIAQNTPVQLAAAHQSELQARARYDAGLASIVEVVESQSLLSGAEYQDAVARVDVWRALLAQAVAAGDLAPFIDRVRAAGVH